MPWNNESPMEQKQRFIHLAKSGHFTVSELCEDFGITRKTGHKWLARYAESGLAGLAEQSRAPREVSARSGRGQPTNLYMRSKNAALNGVGF